MRVRKTSLYLDADKLRALKVLAARRETTITELINEAINAYLKREGGDNDEDSQEG